MGRSEGAPECVVRFPGENERFPAAALQRVPFEPVNVGGIYFDHPADIERRLVGHSSRLAMLDRGGLLEQPTSYTSRLRSEALQLQTLLARWSRSSVDAIQKWAENAGGEIAIKHETTELMNWSLNVVGGQEMITPFQAQNYLRKAIANTGQEPGTAEHPLREAPEHMKLVTALCRLYGVDSATLFDLLRATTEIKQPSTRQALPAALAAQDFPSPGHRIPTAFHGQYNRNRSGAAAQLITGHGPTIAAVRQR
ncbi:hypothetical protein AB0C84_40440 [Actinomadura sp. NPDC048955]|uniref:hypothetical protein n=1 Tax=Actinomadura sp. NPDC048955 TaxID=3158228 RepID=UPI0033C70508